MDSKTFAVILATALAVAAAPVGVAAKSSEDGRVATEPTAVSGTVVSTQQIVDESDLMLDDLRVERFSAVQVWESSDPRLGREVTYTSNLIRLPGSGDASVGAGSWTVADARGVWYGSSTSLGGPGVGGTETLVLTGYGDHAGLAAVLIVDWGASPATFRGAIVPGEIPPAP